VQQQLFCRHITEDHRQWTIKDHALYDWAHYCYQYKSIEVNLEDIRDSRPDSEGRLEILRRSAISNQTLRGSAIWIAN